MQERESVFSPVGLARLREHPTVGHEALVAEIVAAAEPWLALSLEELRELVVGATLERAWHVWSDGHCPACKEDVRMYEWRADAMTTPWKLTCPRCANRFPTNDFEGYYHSGLDADGIFQHALADRSLLVNAEHPAPDDPLREFGVDDGTGYREVDGHWRFVAAYLIYGQWKQRVVQGIVRLADGYAATGRLDFAARAGVMLHRVATLYPSYDFAKQGVMYDRKATDSDPGYVSVWHDSCEETRELALAYDRVVPGITDANAPLCEALGESAAAIHTRIRRGLLEDPLANPMKTYSNFPQRQLAEVVFSLILDPVGNREAVLATVDAVIARSSRCNGSTGEKGMQNYTAFATRGITDILTLLSEMDPTLVAHWLAVHPELSAIWRFHMQTWCQQRFFPSCGDAGGFAKATTTHPAIAWGTKLRVLATRSRLALDRPSFLHRLYRATGDPLYPRLILLVNGGTLDDLPPALAEYDDATLRAEVTAAIATHGAALPRTSVDLDRWHLAIQRSGSADHPRDLWLDYDAGGMHGHKDALNLGLYAHGLDLMSDFGYPPVGHAGGWSGPKAMWYKSTAAHNTVVVDRADQDVVGWRTSPRPEIELRFNPNVTCKTRLWIDDGPCHGMLCESQAYSQCTRYERLSVIVDVSDSDFYVLDILRVVGGREHVKFQHTLFAELTVDTPLSAAAEDFGATAQMRNYQWAPAPADRWSASFAIRDIEHLAPHHDAVTVDYHDLTRDATAGSCEAWVVLMKGDAWNFQSPSEEHWIPRVMCRRSATDDSPLASCFVAIIAPHRGTSPIRAIRRTDTDRGLDVALEIQLTDGRTDHITAAADEPDALYRFTRE